MLEGLATLLVTSGKLAFGLPLLIFHGRKLLSETYLVLALASVASKRKRGFETLSSTLLSTPEN